MKTVIIVLVILIILYVLYLEYYKTKVTKNLDKIIIDGVTILDVRTNTEYNKGHLRNAINIPVGSLNADTTLSDKNKTIITYCSHGIRSYNAVNILNKKGFNNVYNGGAMKHLKKFIIF